MKKAAKTALIVFGALLLLLLLCFIHHRIQLSRESGLFVPLGTVVEVDGHQMSVYTEGEGAQTLVFLSGSGTCSPILDFKALYSQLSGSYRIAVPERFGYGFSDVTGLPRDLDTVLEQTRAALQKAGLTPPYVLCPHSMSGLEALYWAHRYPDEVSAIIGLDMSVPAAYEAMAIREPLLRLLQFGSAVGLTRFLPIASDSAAIRSGALSQEEQDLYRAVFYRRTRTGDMVNEALCVKENVERVAQDGTPDVPILMFCSDGSGGAGFSKEDWRTIQTGFAQACYDAQIIYLDCGHYVHDFEYERIAAELKEFFNR